MIDNLIFMNDCISPAVVHRYTFTAEKAITVVFACAIFLLNSLCLTDNFHSKGCGWLPMF